MMKLLITGATGKVGTNFLSAILSSEAHKDWEIVALCHNRTVEQDARVTVVTGSLSDPECIASVMVGVTHVLHLAAVKESPDLVIDVAVKGLFLLLEEARRSPTLRQFILLGGDCAVGHIFQPYENPITEEAPRRGYQGCYALTKVLEEVMLEQYHIQYGLNGTILRAPWIMEKDDFKYAMTFGPDQFGGPDWADLVGQQNADDYAARGCIPHILDRNGQSLRRNFVHVDDLVSAIICSLDAESAAGQTFNICMNEPVDYGLSAARIAEKSGGEIVHIPSPYHSNWLVNAKARQRLGWRPQNDLEALIERAWAYQRSPDDPRKIWYPG